MLSVIASTVLVAPSRQEPFGTVLAEAMAAGTSTITPAAAVDTQGFQGVLFVADFGTLSAGAVTSAAADRTHPATRWATWNGPPPRTACRPPRTVPPAHSREVVLG